MSTKTISSPFDEKAAGREHQATGLPVTSSLRWAYWLSFIFGLLTAVTALAGLLFSESLYPTSELRQAFLANDVATVFIGLPILLVSMWLAHQGKMIGLLFWPGALFYGLYNGIVYLFGLPLSVIYLLYLFLVIFSGYTLIGLVAIIDHENVKKRLAGRFPEKLCGAILIGLSIFMMLYNLGILITAILNQTVLARPDIGLIVADSIIAAAWLVGGVMLWRHLPLGYVGGTGLLFQGSMLFVGLLLLFILQPLLNATPFPAGDFTVVFIMGLICFIPFALNLRGVIKAS
jgi:hypothetical protein